MRATNPIELLPELRAFVQKRTEEFDLITEERKDELHRLAAYVRESSMSESGSQLTFICTHNSRRSHLSQIWAKVAADAAGLTTVSTFSGGTEATAMNPRVVQSLVRCGFVVETENSGDVNPLYRVKYSEHAAAIECFSKIYDQPPNPQSDFCAVMNCSSADQACPIVAGSRLRLAIRYEDPKAADDKPDEADVYDQRSAQICREMLYAMRQGA